MNSRVICRQNHAFGSSLAEAARNDHAVNPLQKSIAALPFHFLGVHPADPHIPSVRDTAMVKGFNNGKVGVMQLRVLADERDFHLSLRAS